MAGYGFPDYPQCEAPHPPQSIYWGWGVWGDCPPHFTPIWGVWGANKQTASFWYERGKTLSADLLGFETAPAHRTNERAEAAALVEVLQALRGNSAVAWVERQNTGAARVGERFIRFGWRGCSDLLGMLKDGRLLAVEVKAPSGQLRPEQREFLSLVQRFGGVAFVASDCRDVSRELAAARIRPKTDRGALLAARDF